MDDGGSKMAATKKYFGNQVNFGPLQSLAPVPWLQEQN